MIVAIDGYSGTGKSTISKLLAKEVGFAYIRTGSFYRALTVKALECKIDVYDENKITQMLAKTTIKSNFMGDHVKIVVDGNDISEFLNTPQVSTTVPIISKYKAVREYVRALQHNSAKQYDNIVMEGRDIGSVVFPKAEIKVFVDCDINERARRRVAQFAQNGKIVDFEKTKQEMQERDIADTTRKISPLVRLPEAYYLDTTNKSIKECVQLLKNLIDNITLNSF